MWAEVRLGGVRTEELGCEVGIGHHDLGLGLWVGSVVAVSGPAGQVMAQPSRLVLSP